MPGSTPSFSSSPDRPAAPRHIDGSALVGTALSFRGVPYRNGGSDPQGFDCSGFTQYVFAQYGVPLPRAQAGKSREEGPIAVIVGNEGAGIRPQLNAVAATRVEVREQFEKGRAVTPDEVAPGDLIFFSTVAPGPTHVGIAIGGDAFVHAPSSAGVVRVERLGSSYWAPRYVGARRP